MQNLPNGCYCGNINVFPKNWKQTGASVKKPWYIHYRFFDPTAKKEYPEGMLRLVKGMNKCKTLDERRTRTKQLLKIEMELLLDDGYNPIKKTYAEIQDVPEGEIAGDTPFIMALEYAREECEVGHPTKLNMNSQLKFLHEASIQLNLSNLYISELRSKHIKALLRKVESNRPIWNNGRFNKYRTNLMILFNFLIEMELDIIETNPVISIKKKPEVSEIRETLTRQQRHQVDMHLRKKKLIRFRLYIRLFFHTGIRSTELLRVRAKDVDLNAQLVKVTIRKGRNIRIVYKTIKNIAVRYWQLALKDCNEDDYIFSTGLNPGMDCINEKQISRRWHRHVKQPAKKGGLGLNVDFYSYKHGNTTEMMDTMPAEVAAGLNNHKSTAMVRKIYDVKRMSREHEKIKLANNEF